MRAAARLVLLVLLLPSLALLAEGAGGRVWSADAVFTPGTSKVVETRTLTYDGTYYSAKWTLNVPPNATFREARDDRGALAAALNGDQVTVTTRGGGLPSYAFTVTFDHAARAEGPFVGFTARVEGDRDSPTTIRVDLPVGWSLPGWFGGTGSAPDVDGVFRKTGGQYVDFLALPPGVEDPGPDPRVDGNAVLREGHARLAAASARLRLTYVYDTDVYSPTWRIPLPEGAAVLGAETPLGPLEPTVANGQVTLHAPYKAGYHLGARSFTLDLRLAPADGFGGPYRQVNLSLAAAQGDAVTLAVELDPALAFVGERIAGGERVAPFRYAGDGPLRVQVAYLPPVGPDEVRFEAGAYVVHAPRALEAHARATALNASALLPEALGFLGGGSIARPFFVAYTDADVFAWEEGFYTHGLDAISIRASELRDQPDARAHLVPVSTLVHETAHGLLDRAFLDAPDDLSLLHEGVSRLAETHVERHFSSEVVACSNSGGATRCTRQSARPEPDRVHNFLRNGGLLDVTWDTATASPEERGFLYDYSGLVFHAYERTAGPDALRHALAEMAGKTYADDPAADADAVLRTLLDWAPGMTRDQLLYPGRQVAHLSLGQFRACMGELLPPPYPFETTENAPASGCGWPTVGTREAPPPTQTTPTSPPPATTPRVTPTPAPTPTPTPPVRVTPTPSPILATPTPADDEPFERTSAPTVAAAPVPGPSLALLVAALAGALLVLRRR